MTISPAPFSLSPKESPVLKIIEPVLPLLLVPVESATEPLSPVSAERDNTEIDPLAIWPCPLCIVIEPPKPLSEEALSDCPAVIITSPAFTELAPT